MAAPDTAKANMKDTGASGAAQGPDKDKSRDGSFDSKASDSTGNSDSTGFGATFLPDCSAPDLPRPESTPQKPGTARLSGNDGGSSELSGSATVSAPVPIDGPKSGQYKHTASTPGPDDSKSSSDDSDDDEDGYETPKEKFESFDDEGPTKPPSDPKPEPPSKDKFEDNTAPAPPPAKTARNDAALDLVHKVDGMLRLLDLVSEEGSTGLVEKVTMDADGLKSFMDLVCPGAYKSMNRVDFRALDGTSLHPVGVYGSKEEIVRFLLAGGKIDEETAELLRKDQSHGEIDRPSLRSGIYIVHSTATGPDGPIIYVVYWPEDTTWDDDAGSSVKRNRVTFMRYLTKLCDQLLAFISPEHGSKLVWNEDSGGEEEEEVEDLEENARLFSFQVKKTTQQEDSVELFPGFKAQDAVLRKTGLPSDGASVPPSVAKVVAGYPKLIAGEVQQGVLTAKFVPPEMHSHRVDCEKWFTSRLSSEIRKDRGLKLGDDVSELGIRILLRHGLQDFAPDVCARWEAATNEIQVSTAKRMDAVVAQATRGTEATRLRILEAFHMEAVVTLGAYDQTLQALVFDDLKHRLGPKQVEAAEASEAPPSATDDATPSTSERLLDEQIAVVSSNFNELAQQFPNLHDMMRDFTKTDWDGQLRTKAAYDTLKSRFISGMSYVLTAEHIGEEDQARLASAILTGKGAKLGVQFEERKNPFGQFLGKVAGVFGLDGRNEAKDISGLKFAAFVRNSPRHATWMEPVATATLEQCAKVWANVIADQAELVSHRAAAYVQNTRMGQARREAELESDGRLYAVRRTFLHDLAKHLPGGNGSCFEVFSVKPAARGPYHISNSPEQFEVDGRILTPRAPQVEYTIHYLSLTPQDQASLRNDDMFKPSPRFAHSSSISFCLRPQTLIKHIQLADDRVILITEDADHVSIFVEKRMLLPNAVARDVPKRRLRREKLGTQTFVSHDEVTGLLVVLSAEDERCLLHLFVVDAKEGSVRARGSPVDIFRWFETAPSVAHICFVSGSAQEELCIVETSGRCRIFSFVTENCRPACLQFSTLPHQIFSAPDGSCLIVTRTDGKATAYHWDRFGSSEGFLLDLPAPLQRQTLSLTSLATRTGIYLVGIDLAVSALISSRVKVQRRSSEFHLREDNAVRNPVSAPLVTAHNSLVECLSDVWTRFPVVPAVGQDALSIGHAQARIVYVSQFHRDQFQSHFSAMIRRFERATRKPTQRVLDKIFIDVMEFDALISLGITWPLSSVRAGEWAIQSICLVPLQIAIARDNRFLPLKDGLWSSALEQQMLGSSVTQVANSITFGWYESIFTHYDKPVKVVSSMGEQSTGKSYMLAHLVDTSFAGSAMRCTEGVWMCVTPTTETLFVALDFEGVHSLERSVQEDALLVLFNAAISNMILFRNNFAISRNIAGMFTSFQSSSNLFDPDANPSLFQSCLVIVIKDVVDADTDGIVQEFKDKFQRIVTDEQEANFLSRLHRGQLRIYPWPVIESRKYYTAYNRLKQVLFQQAVSHPRAGAFLHTMKTLMAKIKACDWGALDQNLAAQRADQLHTSLPTALMSGVDEEGEPLKDMDNGVAITHCDSGARFYLSSPALNLAEDSEQREGILSALYMTINSNASRQDVQDHEWLSAVRLDVQALLEARITYVKDWATTNCTRFEGHADIQQFRRILEAGIVDLRDGVIICGANCSHCHLLCTSSKRHSGPHTCNTSHVCKQGCSFEHGASHVACGQPAGHAGKHICEVGVHLCGQPCALSGKPGCLGECMKEVDHEEDGHACSARYHGCDRMCELAASGLCDERCALPHDEPHEEHKCKTRGCPHPCALCRRLCSTADHFHGLAEQAVHLCGQVHPCDQPCSFDGWCEVSTDPIAVETTFTGRHDTFQFTKYSQNVKKNVCAVLIPAGAMYHDGPHVHDAHSAKPFHYCTSRCPSCGYVCHLPYGHTQREHETAHGSMSHTEWALEDADAPFELSGHRFGSSDSGAPMLCSVYCSALGRHAHIDFCKTEGSELCFGQEHEHIQQRMHPNPQKAKDYITHALHWRRSGFKDPYSREDQAAFALCDAMCAAPEHQATADAAAQPSYCTLPLLHGPREHGSDAVVGYISNDGHAFSCANPAITNQAYHIIFIADRSTSMRHNDKRPLQGTPVTNRIMRSAPNRFGAVFSAVYAFWASRHGAGTAVRRDAYSVVLFDRHPTTWIENDLTSTPEQLLDILLAAPISRGTNFGRALQHARTVMETHWNNGRAPVIVFLSDGECELADNVIIDLCRRATVLGKPLAFHAVSFGREDYAGTLLRMAALARDVYRNAPGPHGNPDSQCTFTNALDTVHLAETFIGIADSLKKPRAALIRSSK